MLFKLLFASLALPELLRVSSLLWYIKRSCPSNQITKKSCLTFISFPISWKHKGIRIGESPNILLTPPIIGQSKVWQSGEQERRGYSVTSTSFNSHPHFPFLEAAFPQNLHLSITLSPLSCARSLLLTVHTFYSCCRHGASSVRRIWS